MYSGANAEALKPKAAPMPPPMPPTVGDRITRTIEREVPGLDANEMARLRVALVELIRKEKLAAWEAGAEHVDREWHRSEYGGTYWGWPASKDNPHRSYKDEESA